MSMSDTLSDMVARINNGQTAKLNTVNVIYSKLNLAVLNILKKEGFVADYNVVKIESSSFNSISVDLKYDLGSPVIKQFKRVSKPGRRIYCKADKIPKYYNGLGISILSTPKGVLCNDEAGHQNVGGEILCTVF